MANLSSRKIDLLTKLIDKEKITIKDFAKAYSITCRTVYREIDCVNKYIDNFNIKIINTDEGMTFEGNSEEIIKLKLYLSAITTSMKAKTKKYLTLVEILQCKEPVKIQYFAKKINVSNTTISHYLKDIKSWLDSKNINLISRPGVGIYVEADEKNIRQAILELLYKNYNTDQLISLMQKNYTSYDENQDTAKNLLNAQLLNIIDFKTVNIIEKILIKFENTINYQIEERFFFEITLQLALAVKRILINNKINLDCSILKKLKKSREFSLAKIIVGYIEDEIHIKIPEEEIGYIALLFQGMKVGVSKLNFNEKYLNSVTEKIINNISKIFKINFDNDTVLKQDLYNHFVYSIYQLNSGYIIKNPLISEIKEEYANIFNGCRSAIDELKDEISIEIKDDEVGYIAMHFAASIERMKNKTTKLNVLLVCYSGIGVSRMLSVKLRQFAQLNIVAISSVLKIDEIIKKQKIDIIISTIPIKRDDIKVIVVNPLLNENDIKKLEDELNINRLIGNEEKNNFTESSLKNLKSISTYSVEINIIVKNTFYTKINSSEIDGIIQELLNQLLKNRSISNDGLYNIKELLLNRDKVGTILLPNKNFIIYHCLSDDIREAAVVVGKLMKQVILTNLIGKKEKVCTAFLIIAPENKKKSLEVIGDLASSIIEYPDFVNGLNKSPNANECKTLIEETLLKKLYTQIKRVFNPK